MINVIMTHRLNRTLRVTIFHTAVPPRTANRLKLRISIPRRDAI